MKSVIRLAAATAIIAAASTALAGYPMISGLANKYLKPGQSTGAMAFHVQDDKTPAASLVVEARSDNQALVPNDNITLGGSGSTRTVQAQTEPGVTGTATIFITVTDTDGETNQDSFQIESVQAPKI